MNYKIISSFVGPYKTHDTTYAFSAWFRIGSNSSGYNLVSKHTEIKYAYLKFGWVKRGLEQSTLGRHTLSSEIDNFYNLLIG